MLWDHTKPKFRSTPKKNAAHAKMSQKLIEKGVEIEDGNNLEVWMGTMRKTYSTLLSDMPDCTENKLEKPDQKFVCTHLVFLKEMIMAEQKRQGPCTARRRRASPERAKEAEETMKKRYKSERASSTITKPGSDESRVVLYPEAPPVSLNPPLPEPKPVDFQWNYTPRKRTHFRPT